MSEEPKELELSLVISKLNEEAFKGDEADNLFFKIVDLIDGEGLLAGGGIQPAGEESCVSDSQLDDLPEELQANARRILVDLDVLGRIPTGYDPDKMTIRFFLEKVANKARVTADNICKIKSLADNIVR